MRPSRRVAYLVALAATAAAFAVRLLLSPVLGDGAPYMAFFAAVAIAAWYGGLAPGLMATALSGAAAYFFVVPANRPGALGSDDVVSLVLFVAIGWLISGLFDRLRRVGVPQGQHSAAEPLRTSLESIDDRDSVTEAASRVDAVRRSERELSDFFDNASIAIHWVGPDGIILRANQAELDMLGYSAEEYLGRHIAEFHEDQDAIADILRRLSADEILRNYPARLRCRDGSVKDVLISSSVRWADGRFVHTRCFTLDVTDRKRTDQMRGLLAAVVESSEDAVISKSLDGRILSWNSGAQRMFGFSAEEVIGRSIAFLIPEDHRAGEPSNLARVGRGERVESFETVRLARDGQRLDVSVTLSPIRDDSGAIIGVSSIARDIRLRKELERSLHEADRRKDEFLAVLAHELRNPLAPIRNSVAALQLAAPEDSNLRSASDVIERQVRHMARLLDDLLDVSRITLNKLQLHKETVTLREVLDMALETSRPLVEASRQTLVVAMPPEPIELHADPMRLAQAFSNLLNNASKYSEGGSTLRITATRCGPEVIVTVRDEGIGIAPEVLPTIFEMFSQAAHALDRAHGGLGIGLSLVKGLVELHGGYVAARSPGLGRGSEFEVRLPSMQEPKTEALAPESAGLVRAVSRRVLIVDDNRDGADSLALLLQAFGHDVRTAYSGPEAITETVAFRPHVVLMDLGMPQMNGFDAARRLRALPNGEDLVLIAVTGWGQERDRRLTADAGFDAHLVKPIDPTAIRDTLDTFPVR